MILSSFPSKKGGVTAFNGRTGDILPQSGDYTAEMVGARPNTWTPSASEVGAVPAPSGGSDGQVLTKSGSGVVWQDASGGGIVVQGTAPSDTSLGWVDTNAGGVMKYYDTQSGTWKGVIGVWG